MPSPLGSRLYSKCSLALPLRKASFLGVTRRAGLPAVCSLPAGPSLQPRTPDGRLAECCRSPQHQEHKGVAACPFSSWLQRIQDRQGHSLQVVRVTFMHASCMTAGSPVHLSQASSCNITQMSPPPGGLGHKPVPSEPHPSPSWKAGLPKAASPPEGPRRGGGGRAAHRPAGPSRAARARAPSFRRPVRTHPGPSAQKQLLFCWLRRATRPRALPQRSL